MREGIILAGGFGTRLRQAIPNLPKPMAPIAGRPFLEILLTNLADNQFARVVLSVGFMAEKIKTYFGHKFAGIELIYIEEKTPLGTGGATRLAMTVCQQGPIFVFNGDTYLELEFDAIEKQWQQHRNPMIIGKEVPDTARYGCLLSTAGRVTGFAEKQTSGPGLINVGCYILNQGQLDTFPLHTAFSLEKDYLSHTITEGSFDLFVTSGPFIDIGIPEDYAQAQSKLVKI